MKALKKKKKLYQNGGETDPPKKGFKDRKTKPGNRKKVRDVTSNVMGLPSQRVYSEFVKSGFTHPQGHPRAGHPRYHQPGELYGSSYNRHTEAGVRRSGHGQVSRALDPSKSPYIKNIVKGSKGARPAGKK